MVPLDAVTTCFSMFLIYSSILLHNTRTMSLLIHNLLLWCHESIVKGQSQGDSHFDSLLLHVCIMARPSPVTPFAPPVTRDPGRSAAIRGQVTDRSIHRLVMTISNQNGIGAVNEISLVLLMVMGI